jgi:hypothetical protein
MNIYAPGPGDACTWGRYEGHPNDPREPLGWDEDGLEDGAAWLTPEQPAAMVVQHQTVFFGADGKPVTPQPGDWFCELDEHETEEGNFILVEGDVVEYVGQETLYVCLGAAPTRTTRELVCPEGGEARPPGGVLLILQGQA